MSDLVAEWVDKAEGDYRTAIREARARTGPNYDAVCFHCQQCAEKYLKAFMQSRGETIPLIHHLVRLLERCNAHDPNFELIRPELETLNDYAVDIRYPGDRATREEAREAVRAMTVARAYVRARLGLGTVRRKKNAARKRR